jgi:hypothetical protein
MEMQMVPFRTLPFRFRLGNGETSYRHLSVNTEQKIAFVSSLQQF